MKERPHLKIGRLTQAREFLKARVDIASNFIPLNFRNLVRKEERSLKSQADFQAVSAQRFQLIWVFLF